jgi:hypothetical protein
MADWIAKTTQAGLRCWWNGDTCIVQYAKRAFWTYKVGVKGVHARHFGLDEAKEAADG